MTTPTTNAAKALLDMIAPDVERDADGTIGVVGMVRLIAREDSGTRLAAIEAEAADAALARVEEAVRALAACHPECVLWGRTRHLHRLDAEPVLAAIRSERTEDQEP